MGGILILTAAWLAFSLYWISSSLHANKKIQGSRMNPVFLPKIRYAAPAVAIVQLTAKDSGLFLGRFPLDPAADAAGVILAVSGVSLAIYARYYLGINWTSEPSITVRHKLITGGPYAHVRHPIYLGITIGLIGSFIAGIHLWFALILYFDTLYIFKIHREERLMLAKFPHDYKTYQKRTRALIPFLY